MGWDGMGWGSSEPLLRVLGALTLTVIALARHLWFRLRMLGGNVDGADEEAKKHRSTRRNGKGEG